MLWNVKSDCPDGSILFSFTKKSYVDASEELWTIRSPDTHEVLYSSWIPVDNRTETRVECVNKTNNLQYELVMTGMWKAKSNLEIQGSYGNRVFKGTYSESYKISMLTLIDSESEWHVSQQYVNDWSRTIPSDWDILSSPLPLNQPVHYFCSHFTGVTTMTAYEVRFFYMGGIVAYINGIEVYRDNLPLGMILPQTAATSGYSSAEFRGTIRNAYEVSCTECVLAVEIHPLAEEIVEFDAWLAVYESSFPDSKGYPVPHTQVGINSIYDESYLLIADYDTYTGLEFPYRGDDYFYVEFSGSTAQVNMWLISTIDSYNGLGRFKFSAKNLCTDEWSPLESSDYLSSQGYLTQIVQIGGYSTYNSGLYRFYISEYISYSFKASEIRPYVTYNELELVYILPEFEQSYKLVNGSEVSIVPSHWDQVTCLSSPSLPTGLEFDKCSIHGIPTSPQAATTYDIYVYDEFGTKRKTFLLEVVKETTTPVVIKVVIIVAICIICILVIVIIVMVWSQRKAKALSVTSSDKDIEMRSTVFSQSTEQPPPMDHSTSHPEPSLPPQRHSSHHHKVLPNPELSQPSQHHSSHHKVLPNPELSLPPQQHHSHNHEVLLQSPVAPSAPLRPPRNKSAPPLVINYSEKTPLQPSSSVTVPTEGVVDDQSVKQPLSQPSCIVALPTGDVVDVQSMASDKRHEVLKDLHII